MDINLRHITHGFGETALFSDFSLYLASGGIYVLTGASGRGKTTLLHILLGLLSPEKGTVTPNVRFSAVFQENRLLPGASAVENLRLISKQGTDKENLRSLLLEILPEECLTKPVECLSGGMQRRVAIARALLAESDCILMDEPFTGLDEETIHTVLNFILRHRNGRTLFIATHQPDILKPCAPIIISL